MGEVRRLGDIESNSGFEKQKPLTLALSRRERGLTELDGRDTPTWDIELNSGFEKHIDRLPFPSTPWGRGLG
jgi:hypothetical protein